MWFVDSPRQRWRTRSLCPSMNTRPASYGPLKRPPGPADDCAVRVVGYIALLCGGAVIGYGLTRGLESSGGSYAADVALGVVLFVAGGWILARRAPKQRLATEPPTSHE